MGLDLFLKLRKVAVKVASAALIKVAIFGGGPAGVAAAYWLSRPEQHGRFTVKLYTQGWRLGGKCASGRNQPLGNRIEEHGLHLLMGSYQNGFATMRAAYADWRQIKSDPLNAFQSWTDAFLPQRFVTLMAQDGPGNPPAWSPWNFPFPILPGQPGDSPQELIDALIVTMCDWLAACTPATAPFAAALLPALQLLHKLLAPSPAGNNVQTEAALDNAAQAIQNSLRLAQQALKSTLSGPGGTPAAALGLMDLPQDIHRLAILADLGVAIGLGYLFDVRGKGPGAFDALDTQDFRAWLAGHGASAKTTASAPVQAFYDLTFAAIGGNTQQPGSIAAGCALRAQLEMVLGYRNAPLWKMAAGMGDTVFTPFYDVLTARGVGIEFFSRVTGLQATQGGRLDAVEITTQAATVGGAPYAPLVRLPYGQGKFLDCWPNQPIWSQLVNGSQLEAEGVDFEKSWWTTSTGAPRQLNAGTDFDIAILAMPPDAIAAAGPSLAQTDPAWANALNASASVATQSLQLWLKPDLAGLGWDDGSTVLTSFTEPYDSWGDMSQVIPAEDWGSAEKPQSIGYFCGCLVQLGGPVDPPAMAAAAEAAATSWMTGNLATLWPNIGSNPVNNADILGRYDLANFDLSDRYVQTPAGTNVSARFSPATPAGFSNLYTIGDWTKTRFSGGCFESAIESAMLASRAISGFPLVIKTG